MALNNIFKKKPESKKKTVKPVAKQKSFLGESFNILSSPRITEKASNLTGINQYVFEVMKASTKVDIRRAVEEIYGVNVLSVRIINLPGKKIKVGKTKGFVKGCKKAIVKIQEGQKIEILPQ